MNPEKMNAFNPKPNSSSLDGVWANRENFGEPLSPKETEIIKGIKDGKTQKFSEAEKKIKRAEELPDSLELEQE